MENIIRFVRWLNEYVPMDHLQYFNQWTMIAYRIVAGLAMIPIAYAAWIAIKCGLKYLGER